MLSRIYKSFLTTEAGAVAKEYVIGCRKTSNVYPASNKLFVPFTQEYPNLRILIINDFPYDNDNANGYAFWADEITPELKLLFGAVKQQLYKYDKENVGFDNPSLATWLEQGVLPINGSLTIGQDSNRHFDVWKPLMKDICCHLSNNDKPMAILLIGRAKEYEKHFNGKYHHVCCIDSLNDLMESKFFSNAFTFMLKHRSDERPDIFKWKDVLVMEDIIEAFKSEIKKRGIGIDSEGIKYVKEHFAKIAESEFIFENALKLKTS